MHENVAAVDLAGGLARQRAGAGRPTILWGARALVALEGRWAAHLLGAWAAARRSLRAPLARDRAGLS